MNFEIPFNVDPACLRAIARLFIAVCSAVFNIGKTRSFVVTKNNNVLLYSRKYVLSIGYRVFHLSVLTVEDTLEVESSDCALCFY